MTQDLTLAEISTQGVIDINSNFAAVEDAVNAKADDNEVVHLAGAETITGDKTFSGTTTIGNMNGVLKATAGVVSSATAGTDYLTPTGSGAELTGITNGQITYDLAFVNLYTASFTLTSADTYTKITNYYSQNGDSLNNFDVTNQKIVISKAGLYIINLKVIGSSTSTTRTGARINLNGNSVGTSTAYGGGGIWSLQILNLEVGDVIEGYAMTSVAPQPVASGLYIAQLGVY